MAFLGRIFRPKHRKDDKENDNPIDNRDAYDRKSMRSSINYKSRKDDRRVQYADNMMPATAAYHVPTQPKNYKATRSLPGGSKHHDDYNVHNRSFESNFYDIDRRSKRAPKELAFRNGSKSKYETSEYGSQDPSPVGEGAIRSHYNVALDDDSDEEYTKKEKIQHMDRSLKTVTSENKMLKESLMRQKADIKSLREQLRKQDRMEQLFEDLIQDREERIKKLENDVIKYKRYYKLWQQNEMNNQQQFFPNQFSFGMQHTGGRHSLLPSMTGSMFQSFPHQSQHTPSTSAMDSLNGAGEALTNTDISFASPQDNSLLPFQGWKSPRNAADLGNAAVSNGASFTGLHPANGLLTTTRSFQPNATSSPTKLTAADVTIGQGILEDDDDEKDDIKNFRKLAQSDRENIEDHEYNIETIRTESARSNTPIVTETTVLQDEMLSANSTLTRSSEKSDPSLRRSPLKKSLSTDL